MHAVSFCFLFKKMRGDIESYLAKEKRKLEVDKIRLDELLIVDNAKTDSYKNKESDPKLLLNKLQQNDTKFPIDSESNNVISGDSFDGAKKVQSFEKDDNSNSGNNENQNDTVNNNTHKQHNFKSNKERKETGISVLDEADKDFANEDTKLDKFRKIDQKNHKNKQDVEQWISDVFYSNFPSFNDEKKKRENFIQNRKSDFQNYLKQIDKNSPKTTAMATATSVINDANVNKNHANEQQQQQQQQNKFTSRSDKTEIEIIVNNPNFRFNKNKNNIGNCVISSASAAIRPKSTRDKLLQDLKHTELSNMVYSNAIQERNLRVVEKEVEKKKEYQKELMRQIEEKRKEIKLLKEREKREEELLTRKLNEQLKAMQLEKELENKKIIYKTQKNNQNNHLNAMLYKKYYNFDNNDDNDKNSLNYHSIIADHQIKSSENDKENQIKISSGPTGDNKVYKYFSNSAHRENYGKKLYSDDRSGASSKNNYFPKEQEQFLNYGSSQGDGNGNGNAVGVESSELILCSSSNSSIDYFDNFDLIERKRGENKYYRSSYKNLCKFCNMKLKIMENEGQCLNCDDNNNRNNYNGNEMKNSFVCCEILQLNRTLNDLICYDCQKKFACNYCHKLNEICCHCIRNYCINCGKSIALATTTTDNISTNDKDLLILKKKFSKNIITDIPNKNVMSSSTAINTGMLSSKNVISRKLNHYGKNDGNKNKKQHKSSEKSFQILEISYPDDNDDENDNTKEIENTFTNYNCFQDYNHQVKMKTTQKLEKDLKDIEKTDSTTKMNDNEIILENKIWNENNLDDIKTKMNNKLTKYLNNYGDLTGSSNCNSSRRTKSTQTSVENTPKRQISTPLQIEGQLSMPLLKEYPSTALQQNNTKIKITPINVLNVSDSNYDNDDDELQRQQSLDSNSNDSRQISVITGKWEVPIIQKQKISNESPKILTQLGAIRKQLQMKKHNI